MKFKKGDVVYYADLFDNIKKATIKCVHRKDPKLPYELDIQTKSRFYPEDAVFATEQEAFDGVRVDQQRRMTDAIKAGRPLELTQKIPLPERDSRYFMVSEKDRLELDKLCKAVDNYCSRCNIPYMLTVVMGRKKSENGSMELVRTTSVFSGQRTPGWLVDLWDQQQELLGYDEEDE